MEQGPTCVKEPQAVQVGPLGRKGSPHGYAIMLGPQFSCADDVCVVTHFPFHSFNEGLVCGVPKFCRIASSLSIEALALFMNGLCGFFYSPLFAFREQLASLGKIAFDARWFHVVKLILTIKFTYEGATNGVESVVPWYHLLWAMKLHGISSLSRRRKVVLALAAILRDLLGRKGRAMMPR